MVLTFGMTAKDLMLSGFAKYEDPNSGGRQMPGHFGQKKNRIVTGSSPVTTQVPHAVGIALAGKMERKNIVSFVTFGEGSSNQGDFHEGANFASVHKLPVIFMCENNQYAISVPISKQVACERISDRAIGYGMPGVTVDGNDPLAVYRVVKEAVDRARAGHGPTLIETVSYRLTPHSSDDDDRQLSVSSMRLLKLKLKIPFLHLDCYLKEMGVMDEVREKQLHEEVMHIVNEATDYAEQAPYPSPESALKHVYGGD